MIHLELTRFDQTAVLLILVSALALIRERRVLPFGMVLLGALVQGQIVMILLAALTAWHRLDRAASRWIQLKDLAGVFLVMAASMSADALQAFFLLTGVFLITVNLGGGMLGPLPALLLLRQAHPNPEFFEVVLGAGASYWLVAEILRFTKSKHEGQILAWLEALSAIAILASFRGEAERIADEPLYLGIVCAGVALVLSLAFWKRIRTLGFWSFRISGRIAVANGLLAGRAWVSGADRLTSDQPLAQDPDFRVAIDSLIYWVFGIVLFFGLLILLSGGGFIHDL